MGLDMAIQVNKNDEEKERFAWRNEFRIRNWFDKNIKKDYEDYECECDGEDCDCDCGECYFDVDNLLDLKTICEEILRHPEKAEELLPTYEKYEQGYEEDLKSTIEIIEKCLSLDKQELEENKEKNEFYGLTFSYSSSSQKGITND